MWWFWKDTEDALIEWYLNGVKLKSGVELTFEYLTSENEGVYECEARNTFGVSDRKSIEISLESRYGTNEINANEETAVARDGYNSTSLATTHHNHHHYQHHHSQSYQQRNINIQVLSNPQTDHVENGRVKIKCISDIENAVYVWTLVNGTFSKDARVEADTLTLEPFTRDTAGVYRCLAYNEDRNEQASRRININIESSSSSSSLDEEAIAATRQIVDITHKMRIEMISSNSEMKKGGTIKLKCSVGKLIKNKIK